MTPIMYFVLNRITAIFVFAYMYLYTARQFKRRTTIGIMSLTYVITTVSDVARFFGDPTSGPLATMTVILNLGLTLLTGFFISRYRDFRALLTGLMSKAYAVFGDTLAIYCFVMTGDMLISILVQISVHIIVLTLYYKFTHVDFMEILHENDNYWGALCVFPAIYWSSLYAFIIWPNSLADNPGTFPGIALYLAVIFFTAVMIVRYSASDKKRSMRNSNLAFLGKYLDRINAEKEELFKQYGDIESINRELTTIVAYMREAVEYKDMDKIEAEIAKLEEISSRQVERSFCEIDSINDALMEIDDVARDLNIRLRTNVEIPIELGEMETDYADVLLCLGKKAVREAVVTGGRTVNLEMYLSGSELALSILYPIVIPENVNPREYAKKFADEYNKIFERMEMVTFKDKYKSYYAVRAKGSHMAVDYYVNPPIE